MPDFKWIQDNLDKNNYGFLILVGVILLLFWLYKEFRANLLESEEKEYDRIEKAIEVYGELLFNLNDYLEGRCEESVLKGTLIKAYPYFPKKLLIISYDFRNKESIKLLSSQVKMEINNLKSMQYDKISFAFDFFDFIYRLGKRYKLASFIFPFVLLLILVSFTYAFLKATFIMDKLGLYEGMFYFCGFSSIFIKSVFILPEVTLDIIQNKFRHSIKNWLLLIGLFVFPSLFIRLANVGFGLLDLLLLFIFVGIYRIRFKKDTFI